MDRPPRGNKGLFILVVVVLALAGMGTCAYVGLRNYSTPPPDFPLLVDDPDPTLHGTVAFVDAWEDTCVRVIAASGTVSKEVYCLDKANPGEGPALAWLPDGRLEMILYDWPPEEPIRPRWRKIVDVATLAVEDASLEGVADEPLHLTAPGPTPDGRSLMIESAHGGTISILIEDGSGGYRSLLNASGNPDYGITHEYPIWSPDFEWLLVNDGRWLIVTVADPAVTRILAETPATFFSSGIAAVAITEEDLLTGG
jgi:hypothetical protein